MNSEHKVVLTPIAAAVAAVLAPGYAAHAQEPESQEGARRGGVLEEITVTARKREESAQDIPIAIQAISQESLQAMGAKAMEDYARFTPSVNVVTYSNTASVIVFRGAITGPGYIAQSTSSVYLDEVSVTTTGAQPSVRVVDIERVEALSGPQGTLYGSDAQAGTMRIVTNKPDPAAYEAVFEGEVRDNNEGEMSYRGSLVFNLPLIEDTMALRLVGYNDRDGGFIDNVNGHTPDASNFTEVGYPAGFGTLDNSRVVEEDWNDSEITGARASLLWHMSENWTSTLGYMWQDTETGADNYYDQFVGDLKTVRFHDEWTTDEFSVASLTLEADLGFAQLVSATSYYERKNSYLYDVTSYAHYWAGLYCHDGTYTVEYMLQNPDSFPNAADYFANPDTGYVIWYGAHYCQGPTVDSDFFNASFLNAKQDKFAQEFRLSNQGDTIDWIVGLYYERSNDDWQSSFAQPTTGGDGLENLYQDSVSAAYFRWAFDDDYVEGATSQWYSQSYTDWETKAVFGEVTWHLNDNIDLTAGGRYYERSNENTYDVNNPGGFGQAPRNPTPARENVDEEFIPKLSAAYSFDGTGDGAMVYGLYTRGKRPGGINRLRGDPYFPGNYVSDLMDNFEIGYKSNFAGGQGRFNVTGYFMDWSDYQLELVDPTDAPCIDDDGNSLPPVPGVCGQPWQQVVANAGDAHITGVNVEVDYSPNENWILGFNAEWMEAETDTDADLNGDGTQDLFGGLQLPLVPETKAAAWAEYHMPLNWFGSQHAFIRTQWSYQGDSVNILEPASPLDDPNPQLTNKAYTIGDLRFGLQGDTWDTSIFINNLTDERAEYTHGTGQFDWGAAQTAEGRPHVDRTFTNRPREIGVNFRKRWGG